MKYASFLATSYQTFTNESCQLWSYWTEFQDIFTQPTDIIYAINANIEIAISRTVLPSGKRAKNARSINLPSFWQHYLLPCQRTLTNLLFTVQIYHLHVMRSHAVKRLQKSVQYIQRYSTKYASFLTTSYLTFTNEPCQLWSYWTEFHEIFTRYTGIICAANAHS